MPYHLDSRLRGNDGEGRAGNDGEGWLECSGLVCAGGVGFYPVKVDVFA